MDALNEIDGAILEAALSLEEGAVREAFLTRIYRADPRGLAEMRQYIEDSKCAAAYFLDARERRAEVALDLASEWTAQATGGPVPDLETENLGSRLGNYRLIRRIGEGGGGVVFEAEQEEPIQRRVAAKIVRLGMNTESVIARFEIERQALALMDHPNIAKVLEAGSTTSGRPYFVMEFVEGQRITTFCDERKLDLAARLDLFIQVCNAIQHAHLKGVVHRDIKPSNVLVSGSSGQNTPKVIDFGIAKAMDPQAFARPVETSHDQLFGTPVYMSPEQIDLTGLDVDTRSDIYSLGVLLYELLVSVTPFDGFDFRSCGMSKIREALLHARIPMPSQTLSGFGEAKLAEVAAARSTSPSQLVRQIRGDLDWIVMKAMERDRSMRYPTVNGMASDVQRYLSHQPVTATPPGKLYLLGKFIRRNRIAFVTGNLLALFLVTGLIVSTTLYKREKKARREQTRLRAEAQAARGEEQRLRLIADARANLARVAFLLDQGRIDEAEALRTRYPLTSIEPSLEAATVFRSLGDWNATHGRWAEGAECYKLLMQANRLDDPSKVLERSDLIAIAAMLLDYRLEDYLVFRDEVAERYCVPQNKLQAEHLLKVCLISPADSGLLDRLKSAVEIMGEPENAPLPAWAGLARGLYDYRSGNLEQALAACDAGLADPQIKNSCRASIRAVLSMIRMKQGKADEARREMEEVRHLIAESEGREYVSGSSIPAIWFDWVIAGILAREAGGMLDGGP